MATLIQRSGERATAAASLDAALGGDGAVLVLEGAAGIGKSALLDAVASDAADRGFAVLRARASELERDFAYGVARQLLERRLAEAQAGSEERDALLAGVAADALIPLGLEAAPAAGDTHLRALHGLYWLVANLAGREPVVLCVDDAHWADRASLQWLAYAARRLEGVRLVIAIATRPAEPGAEQDLLDALTLDGPAAAVQVSALSPDSVATLLGHALPSSPAPAFVAACHTCTGGNPLLLRELVRRLVADGIAPTADNAAGLADVGVETVARNVRRRLRALGELPTAVARAAAVFGDGARLLDLARMCDADEADVRAAAVALADADIVTREREIAFVHPLVRAAVYQDMAAVERAALHARAGAASPEAERAALHLLHVDPAGDAQVTRTLREAAVAALARGANDAAAAFLSRALVEPPDAADRVAVLAALGEAEARAGIAGFAEHLHEAIAATPDRHEAGRLALLLGQTLGLVGAGPPAFDVIDAQLQQLPPEDPLAAVLDGELIVFAQSYAPLRPRVADRVERYLARFEAGEPVPAEILGALPLWLLRGHAPAARSRAVVDAALADGTSWSETKTASFAVALLSMGEASRARAIIDPVMDGARRRGELLSLALASSLSAFVAATQGQMARAEADARAGWDIAAAGLGSGQPPYLVYGGCGALVMVLVARGRMEEAEACLAQLPGALPDRPRELVLPSRAELRIAQGRTEEAIADLRETGELLGDEFAKIGPNWRTRLAVVLAGRGERDEARALAAAELDVARRFAVPAAVGEALTAAGVAEGGDAGIALLHEAVAVLAGTEARTGHATALVELGAAVRRGGARAEAREFLRDGLDLATRCGLTALGDRAHEELVAAGAKPRRDRRLLSGPDSLTASEYRVAALAAEGLTNRAIAQRLYVTQSAVGFHLKHVFRKLDVSARGDLARALAPDAEPAAVKTLPTPG